MAEQNQQHPELMTARQAAAWLGVRRATVYRMVKEGRLKPYRPEMPLLLKREDVVQALPPLVMQPEEF